MRTAACRFCTSALLPGGTGCAAAIGRRRKMTQPSIGQAHTTDGALQTQGLAHIQNHPGRGHRTFAIDLAQSEQDVGAVVRWGPGELKGRVVVGSDELGSVHIEVHPGDRAGGAGIHIHQVTGVDDIGRVGAVSVTEPLLAQSGRLRATA